MRWTALQKRLEAVQERRRDRARETRRRMQAADRHHRARERREVSQNFGKFFYPERTTHDQSFIAHFRGVFTRKEIHGTEWKTELRLHRHVIQSGRPCHEVV